MDASGGGPVLRRRLGYGLFDRSGVGAMRGEMLTLLAGLALGALAVHVFFGVTFR